MTAPAFSAQVPPAASPAATARLAVLGSRGYAGGEFVRLCAGHPGLEVVALGTRPGHEDGTPSARPFAAVAALAEAGEVDVLVSALPHGAWRALATEHPALASAPRAVVDLSADHRDGSNGYRYGLPEAFRDDLEGATRIANPGCYPTAAALALLPALRAGWVAGPVNLTALSGVSGAGRGPAAHTSFVEVEGGAAAYRAAGDHPHRAEMAASFARLAGGPLEVDFVPQLVPMSRGILLTAVAPLDVPRDTGALLELYETTYEAEPFVRVLPLGLGPRTHAVRGSNRCDLGVRAAHGGRTLVAIAAIDNLVKGAAGQALQNLNRILGWPETTGLPRHGVPW